MNLIMFMDACEHVARICRVIRQPKGNSLLMGVGGSGRQSCSRLANYIMEYTLFQIEITKDYTMIKNWKEDLRETLLKAGADRTPVTFLMVDTQIIDEKMLEDINNVLNSGDVPNLYEPQDMDRIGDRARKDCQTKQIDPTPTNLFSQYIIALKKNIHIIMAMSHLNESFKERLR